MRQPGSPSRHAEDRGGAISLETYLALLYTDDALRGRFLADPRGSARAAGLDDDAVEAMAGIDRAGLQMAAQSYAWKRQQHRRAKRRLADLLLGWARR